MLVNFVGSSGKSNLQLPTNLLYKHDGDRHYLNTTGDGMMGNLDMNSHRITEVATPQSSGDVANKSYIDDQIKHIDKKIEKNEDKNIDSFTQLGKRVLENNQKLGDILRRLPSQVINENYIKTTLSNFLQNDIEKKLSATYHNIMGNVNAKFKTVKHTNTLEKELIKKSIPQMYCAEVFINVKSVPILIYTFNDIDKTVFFWNVPFEVRYSQYTNSTQIDSKTLYNSFSFQVYTKDGKKRIFVTCRNRKLCSTQVSIYFMEANVQYINKKD